MALACVLDASTAVRLIVGGPSISTLSTLSNYWPMPAIWWIGWSQIATCRPRPWLSPAT
jgi:hypothetical protein